MIWATAGTRMKSGAMVLTKARVMVKTISDHLANGSTLEEVLIAAPDNREFDPFKAQIQEGA